MQRLHINGIESYTKTRLVKLKRMDKSMFNLHLKECEFRFNNYKQNLYKILLGVFRSVYDFNLYTINKK